MIDKLSDTLLQVIGARFSIDYDLWTARLYPGDREYFASPLNERGEVRRAVHIITGH